MSFLKFSNRVENCEYMLRIAPTARIWTADTQRPEKPEKRSLVKTWLDKIHDQERRRSEYEQ